MSILATSGVDLSFLQRIRQLFQLRVLDLRSDENGYVPVGIFPERQKIVVPGAARTGAGVLLGILAWSAGLGSSTETGPPSITLFGPPPLVNQLRAPGRSVVLRRP